MAKKLRPVHPGDILLHDFLQPTEMTPNKLSKELGVSAPTVNEIVRGNKSVTAEMALRLSRYFGTTPNLWLNLQAQYDIEVLGQKLSTKLQAITPRKAA